MRTDLTFDELCQMIKSGPSDGNTLNALDAFSGGLMVLAPTVLGVPAASVFGLFGAKNELVKAGKFLISKVTGRADDDKLARHDLLLTAYCLSCYTAFFEAVDRVLPEVRKYLEPSDRVRLTTEAVRKITSDEVSSLARYRIELPHPNDPIEVSGSQLDSLYAQMAQGVDRLLRDLAVWDKADGAARDRLQAAIKELPVQAKEMYKGQYLALCVKFPEFSAWANLQEHKLDRLATERVGADVRAVLELLSTRNEDIDIGLKSLNAALTRVLPDSIDEVLNGLGLTYRAAIEEPVIDDTYASDAGVDLRYPRKSEIFVPQAFRALRYSRGDQLEDEELWKGRPVEHDIGTYVLAHLASPYSLSTPLVVLGQPGSGKSLLTEVLAARLASAEYHPVRVKLRNINPDSDIQDQIEEQIRDDTGHVVNWAELSPRCDRPPLVILDGYDELLQASGKVFGNYLKKVANFQRREQVQGRSVRVIVTSRVTLIDKADVPIGSSILRLEEFDNHRQDKWIKIWNAVNQPYFQAHKIEPFALPRGGDVRNLAQQPLLLLMLALYDSDRNQLSQDQDLDQSVLYHNLLIRFITRERQKDGEFRSLSPQDRGALVLVDLNRLSVAAIGMFNRRALHITKDDLQADIEYFKAGQELKSGAGVPLTQAELLLGSFFFVHESKSGARGESDGPAAFEFLHNTFGEFLAAEWLLAMVLEQVKAVALMRAQPALAGTLQQFLDNRDGLPRTWFATLMVTPLFSRPTVLHMVREWSVHRLRDLPAFVAAFEVLLYSQLKRVLSDAELPTMLLGGETPFSRSAALTNVATYTLNLVLLRCMIGGPFRVDLGQLRSDAFPKPWANLMDLWRAGLGQESLMGVTAVLSAQFDDGVVLTARKSFALPTMTYLHGLYELGCSIGDDQLMALAGWAIQDVEPADSPSLNSLAALPAVSGTAFRVEIRARAALREHAEGVGFESEDRLSRRAKTASGQLLRAFQPQGNRRDRIYRVEVGLLVRGNPELAKQLWNSSAIFVGGLNDIDIRILVLTRPALAADMIAFHRMVIEFPFPRNSDNKDSRVRRFVADQVLDSARAIAQVDWSELSVEVRCELIASSKGVPPRDARKFLGLASDIWAIARRPRATVLRLLDLSERSGYFEWIKVMVRSLDGAGEGPALVQTLGGETTLTLLRYGGKVMGSSRGVDEFDVGRLKPGVVEYAIEKADLSDPRVIVEEYVKLVAYSSDYWLRQIEGHFSVMKRQALAMAAKFEDQLSQSATKALRDLRRRQEVED